MGWSLAARLGPLRLWLASREAGSPKASPDVHQAGGLRRRHVAGRGPRRAGYPFGLWKGLRVTGLATLTS